MKKFAALVFIIFSFIWISSYAKVPAHLIAQGETTISPMLKQAMPAVVNIVSQGELPIPNDPFLQRQLKRMSKFRKLPNTHFASVGSGVIVNAKKGLIVTNAHVVDLSKIIIVTLSDGRRFPAKKLGSDDSLDVALIQIDAKHLTALPFGNSDQLKVGDFVAAIGSPFGLNQSVTSGIISALHRSNLGIEGLENFIQTDAPINMGNSGGALVNMKGQLIGINTALLSSQGGGNIGIGFAIPSNMVKNIMLQLDKYGKVHRGLIGVLVQTLTPELANADNLHGKKGAIISYVLPHSPAEKAGLKIGDIITSINKTSVDSSEDVHNFVGLLRIGDKVHLTILRNGKTEQITCKTADPKYNKINAIMAEPYLYGIKMREITEQTPDHGYVQGIQILHIKAYSAAQSAGLIKGDIIISANHHPIKTIRELKKLAKPNKDGLLLNVLRQKGAVFIVIR